MEENEYTWWIQRIKCALDLYNEFRIDHFGGFVGIGPSPLVSLLRKELSYPASSWHPYIFKKFNWTILHILQNQRLPCMENGMCNCVNEL